MLKETEKEKKERLKKEREEFYKANEKALYDPFYRAAEYWGFDKLEVYVIIETIDANKLSSHKSKDCTFSPAPLFQDSKAKPEWRFNTIKIFDPEFGEFFMSSGGGNPHAKCFRLVLIHGGMNSETTGVLGLQLRFNKAKERLLDYGINLKNQATIRSLELAFTFATDKKLPIEVCKLLLYVLSKSTNVA